MGFIVLLWSSHGPPCPPFWTKSFQVCGASISLADSGTSPTQVLLYAQGPRVHSVKAMIATDGDAFSSLGRTRVLGLARFRCPPKISKPRTPGTIWSKKAGKGVRARTRAGL